MQRVFKWVLEYTSIHSIRRLPTGCPWSMLSTKVMWKAMTHVLADCKGPANLGTCRHRDYLPVLSPLETQDDRSVENSAVRGYPFAQDSDVLAMENYCSGRHNNCSVAGLKLGQLELLGTASCHEG